MTKENKKTEQSKPKKLLSLFTSSDLEKHLKVIENILDKERKKEVSRRKKYSPS